MTDFKRGDRIRVTDKDTGIAKTIWLAEDDETGELFTYHGLDPFAPQVPLDLLLETDFEVELDLAFEDALPTVPGEYEDRVRNDVKLEILSIDPDNDLGPNARKPWVLDEYGRWTAPDGETRDADNNWLLVVSGFEFFPWEDAAVK